MKVHKEKHFANNNISCYDIYWRYSSTNNKNRSNTRGKQAVKYIFFFFSFAVSFSFSFFWILHLLISSSFFRQYQLFLEEEKKDECPRFRANDREKIGSRKPQILILEEEKGDWDQIPILTSSLFVSLLAILVIWPLLTTSDAAEWTTSSFSFLMKRWRGSERARFSLHSCHPVSSKNCSFQERCVCRWVTCVRPISWVLTVCLQGMQMEWESQSLSLSLFLFVFCCVLRSTLGSTLGSTPVLDVIAHCVLPRVFLLSIELSLFLLVHSQENFVREDHSSKSFKDQSFARLSPEEVAAPGVSYSVSSSLPSSSSSTASPPSSSEERRRPRTRIKSRLPLLRPLCISTTPVLLLWVSHWWNSSVVYALNMFSFDNNVRDVNLMM